VVLELVLGKGWKKFAPLTGVVREINLILLQSKIFIFVCFLRMYYSIGKIEHSYWSVRTHTMVDYGNSLDSFFHFIAVYFIYWMSSNTDFLVYIWQDSWVQFLFLMGKLRYSILILQETFWFDHC
jgi:hypothetical protein